MKEPYFIIKPARTNKKLERFMKATRRKLSSFFGCKTTLPSVFFVNSRSIYDQLDQRKTASWMVGNADGNNIFIFDMKSMARYSKNNYKDRFWKVLKHEYAHIVFRRFCWSTNPKWLNEGLACYLASQPKKLPDSKLALKVLSYYHTIDENVYIIGYFWVKYLIDRYGKGKFLKLLKSLRNIHDLKGFKRSFYNIFGFKFEKLVLKKIYNQYRSDLT